MNLLCSKNTCKNTKYIYRYNEVMGKFYSDGCVYLYLCVCVCVKIKMGLL